MRIDVTAKQLWKTAEKKAADIILPSGILAFLLILAMTFLFRFSEKGTLMNVPLAAYPDNVSMGTWYDGTFQKNWAAWLRDNFYGHTTAIKLRNQIAYTFFSDGNGVCDYGRNGYYFNNDLLYAGVGGNSANLLSEEAYDTYAQKVYALQTKLEEQGKSFLYVLVPHKLEIYPEYLPWNDRILWKKYACGDRTVPGSLAKAFDKYGVHYYDPTDLLLQIKENEEYDAYSPTGHHWTVAATASVLNGIFSEIETLNPSVSCPEIHISELTDQIYWGDRDVYWNMNMFQGKQAERYTVPVLEYTDRSQGTLYMMGTSFTNEMRNALSQNIEFRPFQKTIRQGYFGSVTTIDSNGVKTIDYSQSNRTADFGILANLRDSDIVIMEQLKEMGILSQSERFVDYANQYFDQMYYHLGDNILLYTEDLTAFSGFYDLQENERWTDGAAGTIRIYGDELKAVGGEVALSAEICSYHYGRHVDVLFNEQNVGSLEVKQEWGEYHLTVPKDLVLSGENTITFVYSGETYSPLNVGESSDSRNLGLGFRNVSLTGGEVQ